VRPEVTFIIGGVHASERLALLRIAAPGRRLVICNGMAYALAQRRRLLGSARPVARSARDCFLHNCAVNDREYARILKGDLLHQMQHDADPNIGYPSNSVRAHEATDAV